MGDVVDLGAWRRKQAAELGYERAPTDLEELITWPDPPAYVLGLGAPGTRSGWVLTPAQAERLGLLLIQAAAVMRLEVEISEDGAG